MVIAKNEMINVDTISVSLGGHPILRQFSLKVEKGEKLALFGTSGSGKSTLLKTLIGMHIPTDGTIYFGGLALNAENLPQIRKQLFYLPQDILPQGEETTIDFLKRPFQLHINQKIPFPEVKLHELFDRLHLKRELLIQPMYNLSGGERKRVGLLSGLLLARPIILADEPTAGVDAANRDEIADMLFAQNNTTVVAVTHDEALMALANRTVNLNATPNAPSNAPSKEANKQHTQGADHGRP